MSVARFKVVARLDMASRDCEGTVLIDRTRELFSVRPHRRRKLYTLPLSVVADMVVKRIVQAEVFARRLEKSKKKKKARTR